MSTSVYKLSKKNYADFVATSRIHVRAFCHVIRHHSFKNQCSDLYNHVLHYYLVFSFLSYLCHYTIHHLFLPILNITIARIWIRWLCEAWIEGSVAVSIRVTDLLDSVRLNLIAIDEHLIRCDFSYFDDIAKLICHTTTTSCGVPYITLAIISCAVQISVDCRLKMAYHSCSKWRNRTKPQKLKRKKMSPLMYVRIETYTNAHIRTLTTLHGQTDRRHF